MKLKELLDTTKAAQKLSELPREALEELQDLLNSSGYLIALDGSYGPETRTAFSEWSKENHLDTKGSIGWGSYAALLKTAKKGVQRAAPREALVSTLSMPGLTGASLTALVAPNCGITWAEMTRNGERLPVSAVITDNMITFAEAFAPLRQVIGKPITITSAYRPPSVNQAVGGVWNSHHLFDRPGEGAIDFYVSDEDVMSLYDRLRPHWNGGLAYSIGGQFIHVDNGPWATWQYS